jgi:histidinol-phosphatase
VTDAARPTTAAPTAATVPDPAALKSLLDFAFAACDEADALALSHFRRDLHIETKPDRSFVTQADRAIEEGIRRRIQDAYPDDGLVGEEYGELAAPSGRRWYIDPIDGTHNFMRGVPLFGTLLALEAGNEIVLGVVSAPALRTRWYAARGSGAWAVELDRNGGGTPRPIRVSAVEQLGDSQLLYASPVEMDRSGLAPGFGLLLEQVWRDRAFGDFWGYALVAEGAAEAMVESAANSWDLAAPMVVVEEAGGRFTDFEGRRTVHGGSVVASNGSLHDEVLRALRPAG